jgi:hypothetical protein
MILEVGKRRSGLVIGTRSATTQVAFGLQHLRVETYEESSSELHGKFGGERGW